MKLLITGATGLIGSNLVDRCLNQDIEVHYLTTSKQKLDSESPAKGFFWNPENGEIDLGCFEGVDGIINLAGAPIAQRWTESNKAKILNSRVKSLETLRSGLQRSGADGVSTLVSASAIGIYPSSSTTYYSEDDKIKASGFAAEVVEAWEAAAFNLKDLIEDVAVLRIGLVLSDEGGALDQMAKPVRLGLGSAFGSGEQWQSWIHIDDLTEMFLFLTREKWSGVFNAVAPNPVTQNKLIKELAKVLNKPLFMPNIPATPLKWMLGEMSEIVLSSQRVSSKKIESRGYDFTYQNICRALEAIYTDNS